MVLTMSLAYTQQMRANGLVMWFAQPNNWLDAMTVVLQAVILACHITGWVRGAGEGRGGYKGSRGVFWLPECY